MMEEDRLEAEQQEAEQARIALETVYPSSNHVNAFAVSSQQELTIFLKLFAQLISLLVSLLVSDGSPLAFMWFSRLTVLSTKPATSMYT
jgi:hypothetical protein